MGGDTIYMKTAQIHDGYTVSSAAAVAAYTDIAFRDLVDIARYNEAAFDELYYNRETEFTLFNNIMSDARATGINVIVKGQAGSGKSNFIYKLLRNANTLARLQLHAIMIDYRRVIPSNAAGCLIHFLQEVKRYFEVIGEPIHTLKDLTDDKITVNMQVCYKHLEQLPESRTPHLLIVLDDFDYAENEWFLLLDYFLAFAASRKASVVFTVRPLLLSTVEAYDDRFNHYYNRHCQLIDLKPLDVPRILATRIALILKAKDNCSLYGRICERIRRQCNGFREVLEQLGIKSVDDLPTFEYPFTERHNMFMRRITNGNIREIFDIATDSLIYMLDPNVTIISREEDGVERRSIGREGDLKLFMDDYPRKKSPFRIINIHELRSRNGNSLYYNVLELVKLRKVVDDTFYAILQELGHRQRDIDHALSFLTDKSQRLIEPIRLRQRSSSTLVYDMPEYRITDKGDYYMQICSWNEYASRCGTCGISVEEII